MARHLILALVTTTLLLAVQDRAAEACSIASSYAREPEVLRAYDAALAPAKPMVFEASVSHSYEEGPACGNATCGDIHALNIYIAPIEEGHLLRITHSDGLVTYAQPGLDSQTGEQNVFLLGYEHVDDNIQISIAVIDEDGYPSAEVVTEAYNEQDVPGCSAGGRGRGLSMGVLLLLALVMGRRRRRSHSTDPLS